MITDQKELFPEGKQEISLAEVMKYAARLRDEFGKLKPLPDFREWLTTRIFDAGDRLKFAAVLAFCKKLGELHMAKRKIVRITISPGRNFGEVDWEISHER